MLSQLVYVSNRNENCSDEEINNILEACKRNNPALGITGILLYSDSKFIQVVEGEAKAITSLYDKIKLDNRHSKTLMVSYGPIKEKSFPSWHMAARSFNNEKTEFKSDISPNEKAIFQGLLNGEEEQGDQIVNLLKKFFK